MRTPIPISLAGALLCGVIGSAYPCWADMPPAAVVAQMKGGTITAVGTDGVQIDGTTYQVSEKAQIVDHEGQPLPLEDIRLRALVRYLLKAGKIESMVVTNPQ